MQKNAVRSTSIFMYIRTMMALRNQALELLVRRSWQRLETTISTTILISYHYLDAVDRGKMAKQVLQPVPTKDDPVQHWLLRANVIRPGSQLLNSSGHPEDGFCLQFMSLLFPRAAFEEQYFLYPT